MSTYNHDAVFQFKNDVRDHIQQLKQQNMTNEEIKKTIDQRFAMRIGLLHDMGLRESVQGWIMYQITYEEKYMMYWL